MYPKLVTEKIVEYWAKGLSAHETQKALNDSMGIRPNLNTIYKHRHSLTAKQLIDELLRQQERAILKADSDNPELALRYRNELLKLLLPKRMEITEEVKEIQLTWVNDESHPADTVSTA